METRILGRTGVPVPAIGLGCNNFGMRIELEQARAVVHKALDLGILLFDTADVYGDHGNSERFLGQILGSRRADVLLATKFGSSMDSSGQRRGASRRHILWAVDGSLRRLQTDWIDLYQLHYPDPRTPIEETLRALDDLVRQGKVRYIGCSNFPAWQVAEARGTAQLLELNGFVCCQDEYSLLHREIEQELIPAIQAFGFGLLPYFPLASGLLTGKYKRGRPLPENARLGKMKGLADRYLTEKNWSRVERLEQFSSERGHSLLELAFSWLIAQPTVTCVIAGATTPEQVEQNTRAADWALTPDERKELDLICSEA